MKSFRTPQNGMSKVLVAITFLGVFACQSMQKSLPRYDEALSQSDVSAFPWVEVSEQEMFAQSAPTGSDELARPLSDPLRQRLQFWMDQLDAMMREKDPVGMQNVPRPQIALQNDPIPQAFVGSVDVCLNKTGQMQDAEGKSEDFIGLDRELGGIFTAAGPRRCVDVPYKAAELQKFMSWYVKPFPGCRVRVHTRRLDFNADCLKTSLEGSQTSAHGRNVFVRLSSQWILVSAALVQSLTEYEAVYTIFHEAAHYYKSHLSQPLAEDDAARELNDWLKAKRYGSRNFAAGMPGQRYHSGLYGIAKHEIQDWIRREGSRVACKDLSQHFLTAKGLESFPQEKPDQEGQTSYQVYEQKVEACLAGLPFESAMQERMMRSLTTVVPWSARTPLAVPAFKTASEFWKWLSHAMPDMIAAPEIRVAELSKPANASGRHVFTREVEADQLTASWLAHFGIDPQRGMTATWKRMKLEGTIPQASADIRAYTHEQCVRGVSDPHQNSCVRALSLRQALRSQGSRAPSTARVVSPGPAWDALARDSAGLPYKTAR